ncbi:MAG: serine/threonine-protein kinase, partial [Dokdonella sp.]
NGNPYFAMEFVDGAPLLAHVAAQRCDVGERLRLFLQICAALQFAHRQLVVHRDIKPSNVLVARDGSVKLLDFGIATLVGGAAAVETQTQLHPLTPAYAAPEQLRGEAVTTATDIYALGAVLHELLTGVCAYRTVEGASGEARLRAVENSSGAYPSIAVRSAPATQAGAARKVAAVEPVPERILRGDLDLITSTALRAEASRRYATVDALADDIRRFLEGRPISARADTARYRLGKFVARHRSGVALAAIFLAALIAALVTALVQAEHAREQARQARAAAALARQQTERAEGVRRFLVGVFEQATPDANQGKPLSPHQLLEKGEQQLVRSAGQPALQADAAALLAVLYQQIGDFERADALLKRALADAGDARVPDDVKARVLVGIAVGEDEAGTCDDALAHAREGLALLKPDDPGSAETQARAHDLMAHCLIGNGEMAAAESLLNDALRQDSAALGPHNEIVGEEWILLGNVLAANARFAEAEKAFHNGIDIWRSSYGDDSNHVAHALNELSNALSDKGDLAGAEDALRQSLQIRMRSVGPDHRDTLVVQVNLLGIIEAEGRFAEGVAERLRLRERGKAAGQLHAQDLISSHLNVGKDYRELGLFDQAIAELRAGLEIVDTSNSVKLEQQRVSLQRFLGTTRMLAGEYPGAEDLLRKALAGQLQLDPSGAMRIALLRLDLGNLLRRQQRHAEALEQLGLSRAAIEATRHQAGATRSNVLAALGETQLDAGHPEDARATAEAALAAARQDLPATNYQLGTPLLALARVDLAQGRVADAEGRLREALAVRSPPYPAADPRVLEVQVALANALALQARSREVDAIRAAVEPALRASPSPYAAELLARLTGAAEKNAAMQRVAEKR